MSVLKMNFKQIKFKKLFYLQIGSSSYEILWFCPDMSNSFPEQPNENKNSYCFAASGTDGKNMIFSFLFLDSSTVSP